jgi:Ca-activated chloride channel family protein
MVDKIGTVETAARGFLDTLRSDDRGAVVAFNDHVQILQTLTSDREALARAVNLGGARGNTALHSAVYVALKTFALPIGTDRTIRRQAIVVLSDGEDTSSLMTFEDVLGLAREMGVNIYTVRLRTRDEAALAATGAVSRFSSEADFEMRQLARETGALAFFPMPDRLQAVYASIAAEVASQYSIGYEPARRGPERALHHVSVQIVDRPDLRARTRAGYASAGARIVTP